jgi:uncharacterized protein YkwD
MPVAVPPRRIGLAITLARTAGLLAVLSTGAVVGLGLAAGPAQAVGPAEAVGPAQAAGPAQPADLVRAGITPEPGDASQLLALTNQARAAVGVRPLGESGALTSVAVSWAEHMATDRQLGHNPSLTSEVSGWSMIGENAAMGWSVAQVEAALMASPPHRANILQPLYNQVGVGVARATDGSLWFTVDFMQSSGYVPKPASPPVHRTAVHRASTTGSTTHRQAVPADRSKAPRVRSPHSPPAATPRAFVAAVPLAPRLFRLARDGQAQAEAQPGPGGIPLSLSEQRTAGLADVGWLALLVTCAVLVPAGFAVSGPGSAALRRTARSGR